MAPAASGPRQLLPLLRVRVWPALRRSGAWAWPLLLGAALHFYRRWQAGRRRLLCAGPSAGSTASGGSPEPRRPQQQQQQQLSRVPPPRPGVDDDRRFQLLDDDPRYFEGAELGKAQKAALGYIGLTGRNTASFDPKSTLVRPAMRVVHGPIQACYDSTITPDDLVIVADGLCKEADLEIYTLLEQEAPYFDAEGRIDSGRTPTFEEVLRRVCEYFAIDQSGCEVCIARHHNGVDQMVFHHSFGETGAPSPTPANCIATAAFGAASELALERIIDGEGRGEAAEQSALPEEGRLHVEARNGHLLLVSRDVDARWRPSVLPARTGGGGGHIRVTVVGASSRFAEEQRLGPMPERIAKAPRALAPSPSAAARPTMRIILAAPDGLPPTTISHDDVIVIPSCLCDEADWSMYYELLQEVRDLQAAGARKAEWSSWHEGSHLLTQNPTGSRTFQQVLDRLCERLAIEKSPHPDGNSFGTRFNWYRDGSDWKPFHHDSAAFNPQRARLQNCTVGVSLGATRELAFRHAKTGELIYFPQTNGMLFFFGRDVNIRWQHGINALPLDEQDGKGRISIIVWGNCEVAVEEPGAPTMLTDEMRAPGGGGFNGAQAGSKSSYGYNGGGRREKSMAPCRNFQRGSCHYGDRCRFSHGEVGGS
eukprot:TRINITY_DN3153_c0_g1_i1.p1 TRINITY_DN3153_c0_g1~~TRINITY_DN3153_c0_g1_i1.p1  ORF type:complete len:666 (-),score=162.10 TRINITY_DN3153_c0_g1_i1:54-2003(-)